MIDELYRIAEKYGIGEDACREIEELLDGKLALAPTQAPTQSNDDEEGDERPQPTSPLPARREAFAERYQDIRRIGSGGFSEVREVLDRHVGRRVARKVQLPTMSSPDDCARSRSEVAINARLDHPGVVPLYDWGELPDGRVWFTMKRVHGHTLGWRIKALHRLEGAEFVLALRRMLDDFRRICEPLAHAHALRIIHRDIKPQNLMIGALGEVHVMDWGLARDLGDRAELTLPSSLGAPSAGFDPSESSLRTRVAGTPQYMPPEQARGDIAAMGPASDVYALGAVLYEILRGRPPYKPSSGEEEPFRVVLDKVLRGPPEPIDQVARREAPAELFPLCQRAMERDPADRFAHAGELMTAMRDWLDGVDRRERAHAIVASAHREHRPSIERMRADARRKKARAREILDKLRSFDRAQDKAEGWKLADDAAAIEQDAMREEIIWTQKLRSALNDAPDLEEAHTALADHYAEVLLRAETEHDQPAATRYATLLESHTGKLHREARARYERLLRGEGRLTLVTDIEGARAVIKRYEPVGRYLMFNEEKTRTVSTPIRELDLQRGSYLVLLTAPGYREVRYPAAIGRGEHWDGVRPGSGAPYPIRLLREEELGEDDVYVPAGWFIAGGDPHAGESLPRRRAWLDGFVIRKHPVTNAEYVEFLNALSAEGRADEALRHCPRQSPGATLHEDALAYLLDASTGRYALKAPEAERTLPVVFVDWHAATAYATYLARKTGLPWRLPSELEWEKAARGVDGRFMPWGDHVEPTWACVAGSHAERQRIMPVHNYLTDVSPYGVRGMAGNVRDWCADRWTLEGPRIEGDIVQVEADTDADADRLLRGGAWISVGDMTRLSVRYSAQPTKRHGVLGFRLARRIAP